MTDILDRLEAMIADRRKDGSAKSGYVAKQLEKGRLKLAEKLGEEAV